MRAASPRDDNHEQHVKGRSVYSKVYLAEMGIPVAMPPDYISSSPNANSPVGSPATSFSPPMHDSQRRLAEATKEQTLNVDSQYQQEYFENYEPGTGDYDDNVETENEIHESSVDYTPKNFLQCFKVIQDAARRTDSHSRSFAGSASVSAAAAAAELGMPVGGGPRVRKEGDTIITTDYPDPYSFYWHADKLKRPARVKEETYVKDNVVEEFYVSDETTQVLSPDSHDSGIQVEYGAPLPSPKQKPSKPRVETEKTEKSTTEETDKLLPDGWVKKKDPHGFTYYWHPESGTVQREFPQAGSIEEDEAATQVSVSLSDEQDSIGRDRYDRSITSDDKATQMRPVVEQKETQAVAAPASAQQPIVIERAFKQTTSKRTVENESSADNTAEEFADSKKSIRFAVRSLGWTEIAEENLTPEKSSRAVNQAIMDLSTGRNDFMEKVARWGDGKELIMELDSHDLKLRDADSDTVLHSQPIHQIRVWGVGRNNGRDFAYVARDHSTRKLMCHVFRCDTPASTIANALRDICKRLMQERRQNAQQQYKPSTGVPLTDSFPTPMEEPKKVIRCHFLGVTQVPRATGIEILNEAVDRLVTQVHTDRWILVDVSISPSTIIITEVGGSKIAECRVRFLSFLGIGRDAKHCAYIMCTSAGNYMCYVFHVEPSAGAIAKTIQAACKLRYQKVIDAHGQPNSGNRSKDHQQQQSAGVTKTTSRGF